MSAAGVHKDAQTVINVEIGYPIDVMERLIHAGEDALDLLHCGLKQQGGTSAKDRYPCLVVLGEIASEQSAAPLCDLLRDETDMVLCQAAARALGRIGEPAMPRLSALLDSGTRHERFWALTAFGHMGTRTATAILRRKLDIRDIAVPAASALAIAGDRDSIGRIYSLYRGLPTRDALNLSLESILSSFAYSSNGRPDDWRKRRRMPPDWEPWDSAERDLYSCWIEMRQRLPAGLRWKRKPLAQLFDPSRVFTKMWDLPPCGDCRYPVHMVLGSHECPETAFASTLYVEMVLRVCRRNGGLTVPDALDLLDIDARQCGVYWSALPNDARTYWMSAHLSLERLLKDGRRSIENALAAVRRTRSSLGDLWGLPLEMLADARMLDAERAVARGKRLRFIPRLHYVSDTCPCGCGEPLAACHYSVKLN